MQLGVLPCLREVQWELKNKWKVKSKGTPIKSKNDIKRNKNKHQKKSLYRNDYTSTQIPKTQFEQNKHTQISL